MALGLWLTGCCVESGFRVGRRGIGFRVGRRGVGVRVGRRGVGVRLHIYRAEGPWLRIEKFRISDSRCFA